MKERPEHGYWFAFFFLVFGILLPGFTLLIEAVTSLCASEFFDPIPTVFHMLLVAAVPVVNTRVYTAVIRGQTRRGAGRRGPGSP